MVFVIGSFEYQARGRTIPFVCATLGRRLVVSTTSAGPVYALMRHDGFSYVKALFLAHEHQRWNLTMYRRSSGLLVSWLGRPLPLFSEAMVGAGRRAIGARMNL